MSEREMHEQDLEVIRVVKANADARKADRAEQVYCDGDYEGWEENAALEARGRVLQQKILPVLGWAGGGVAFLIAMSHGLCGVEMGLIGSVFCFIRTATVANLGRRKEMFYV